MPVELWSEDCVSRPMSVHVEVSQFLSPREVGITMPADKNGRSIEVDDIVCIRARVTQAHPTSVYINVQLLSDEKDGTKGGGYTFAGNQVELEPKGPEKL